MHHATSLPVLVPSHNQKRHAAPHFEYLYIRSVIVPLMIPSASCDADTGANCVTWPKNHFIPHFNHLDIKNALISSMNCQCHVLPVPIASHIYQLSWPKECSGAANDTIASCDADVSANHITWPKYVVPNFCSLHLRNVKGAIGDTISITWCQFQ